MMDNNKPLHGFFRDDGMPINPELVPKPNLCVSCRKDGDPAEKVLCILTRADQEGETEFMCHAFVPTNRE